MDDRWNVDGYFKISSLPEGIFLTIYPPLGKGSPVKLEEVFLAVKEKNIRDINHKAIQAAVRDSDSVAVKIGENPELMDLSKVLLVETAKDELSAYLTILVPPESGQVITSKRIRDELKKKHVVYGILDEVFSDALKQERYNEVILVARGIKPIDGKDARIDFRVKKEKGPPLFDEKRGRVDYKECSPITSVSAGEVLVTKTPASKGIPGRTVTGKELSAQDGKEIYLPRARNVEVSADGLELRATVAGRVSFVGERINVDPIYLVEGDVDYDTGNIDFPGSVVINGNVLGGFTVMATGDIEIKGAVEKAKVVAGGNIKVGSGILGKREGILKAGGDISAKFAEYSFIESQGDVIISESILHSYVDARKRVILNGRMGTILGGRVRAGQEVIAKVIGSWTEIPTTVEVGVEPRIREEIDDLVKEIEADKKHFNELKLGIKTLQTLKEKLKKMPPSKEELLKAHLEAQNFLMARLRDASERMAALNREISMASGGRIAVYNLVHPGVRISIRAATLLTREEYKFVVFAARGGTIEVRPYEEKMKMERKAG